MDPSILVIILQLIFLEGILSLDNAAVLGAMVAHLPADRPIPWPRALRWLQHSTGRWLGPQRQAALKVGLLGAYLGRGTMLVLAGVIVHLGWVRMLGAAYLLYLATSHFAELYRATPTAEEAVDTPAAQQLNGGFWLTVLAIELADLAFSIDNVIAAVALSDQLWVVLIGVAIGIVIMRFAATLFTRLIAWEPTLETGAYLLLLAIGSELLLGEFLGVHIDELAQFAISATILVMTVMIARSPWRTTFAKVCRPILGLFAIVQWAITGVCTTLALPLTQLFRREPPL